MSTPEQILAAYHAAIEALPSGLSELTSEQQTDFLQEDQRWEYFRRDHDRCSPRGAEKFNRDLEAKYLHGETFDSIVASYINIGDNLKRLKIVIECELRSSAFRVLPRILDIALAERVRFVAARDRVLACVEGLESLGVKMDPAVLVPCNAQIGVLDAFIKDNACGRELAAYLDASGLSGDGDGNELEDGDFIVREPRVITSTGFRESPSTILRRLCVR